MRLVIQRVSQASVTVADTGRIAQIGKGLLVLIGVGHQDDTQTADLMIKKIVQLRIFEDQNGKTNLSLNEVEGSLLLISQFTLYANCKKGNRPSFIEAGPPEMAEELYQYIISECRKLTDHVETGSFGADMKVELCNEGPFTIVLDSAQM